MIILTVIDFHILLGEDEDYRIVNDTMFVITPQVSQVCLQFLIFDDDAIEDPENFTVTIIKRSGQIVGNTTVIIVDNDGECVYVCMCVYVGACMCMYMYRYA
jgi:hypothetical protein